MHEAIPKLFLRLIGIWDSEEGFFARDEQLLPFGRNFLIVVDPRRLSAATTVADASPSIHSAAFLKLSTNSSVY